MTDAELSALVAEKVAGYTNVHTPKTMSAWGNPPDLKMGSWIPDYLHDANAVIGLLERADEWEAHRREFEDEEGFRVRYIVHVSLDKSAGGEYADTFCRAACLALLKAHGATNGGEGSHD